MCFFVMLGHRSLIMEHPILSDLDLKSYSMLKLKIQNADDQNFRKFLQTMFVINDYRRTIWLHIFYNRERTLNKNTQIRN